MTITGTPISAPVTTPASLARLLNLYVGLSEMNAAADVAGSSYDAVLLRMASHASRMLDAAAGRLFYPSLATRYFDGSGEAELWLAEPVLAISAAGLSSDFGATYGESPVEDTDWWASDGVRYGGSPTQLLVMAPAGSYGAWYKGRRSVRITGVWGWHRNYAAAWVDSGDTLAETLSTNATTLSVADANGAGQDGLTPRFEVGQLLCIESEFLAVTGVDTDEDELTVVRGCNGTTAATHAAGQRIDVWQPDELVRQCTLIQAVRWFKRGQAAFQDVTAAFEMGQLTYAKRVDPEVEFMLLEGGLRRLTVG